jgi:hypothetical protein
VAAVWDSISEECTGTGDDDFHYYYGEETEVFDAMVVSNGSE